MSGTINARVVDRLCRFGLRWIPWGDDAADVEQRDRDDARPRSRQPAPNPTVSRSSPTCASSTTEGGAIDAARTVEPVPRLVAAGATDLRVRLPRREPGPELEAELRALVDAFSEASD